MNDSPGKERWPDAEESTEDRLSYDPRDAASIASARERLQKVLGLPYPPTLCSDPARSRLRDRIARLFGRYRN